MTPSSTTSSYVYGPDGPRPDSEGTPNGALPRPLLGHPGWHPARGETADLAAKQAAGARRRRAVHAAAPCPGQVSRRSRARPPSGRAATRADNARKMPISGARGMTGDTTGAPAPPRRPGSGKCPLNKLRLPRNASLGYSMVAGPWSRKLRILIRRQRLRHEQSLRDHGRSPRLLKCL